MTVWLAGRKSSKAMMPALDVNASQFGGMQYRDAVSWTEGDAATAKLPDSLVAVAAQQWHEADANLKAQAEWLDWQLMGAGQRAQSTSTDECDSSDDGSCGFRSAERIMKQPTCMPPTPKSCCRGTAGCPGGGGSRHNRECKTGEATGEAPAAKVTNSVDQRRIAQVRHDQKRQQRKQEKKQQRKQQKKQKKLAKLSTERTTSVSPHSVKPGASIWKETRKDKRRRNSSKITYAPLYLRLDALVSNGQEDITLDGLSNAFQR